jgi:hypothetical protein
MNAEQLELSGMPEPRNRGAFALLAAERAWHDEHAERHRIARHSVVECDCECECEQPDGDWDAERDCPEFSDVEWDDDEEHDHSECGGICLCDCHEAVWAATSALTDDDYHVLGRLTPDEQLREAAAAGDELAIAVLGLVEAMDKAGATTLGELVEMRRARGSGHEHLA